ncbi:MAG: hypothetical protein DHS20C08_21730 [Rhodomicrobium sp.]|nr:MAG: hypothetical protein DHS20C08_21730 [Rhodomicrobium sp.]
MEEKAALILRKYVDLSAYPLDNPDGDAYLDLLARVHGELARDGVSVLKNFIKTEWLAQLEAEGVSVADAAYYQVDTVNAYNLPLDADLPTDHPAKIKMQRENAFVARDLIPHEHIIHQLYNAKALTCFVASCFHYDELYQLADPLSGLVLNVLRPGCSHPWHFDVNEFTVSLLTKKPQGGGEFFYCPDIRSPHEENLDAVREVLTGKGEVPRRHSIVLEPGDLQLFKGRYALHHVAAVRGHEERHSAIFAYTKEPDVVGAPERARQLFGRVLPEHVSAAQRPVRSDELLD